MKVKDHTTHQHLGLGEREINSILGGFLWLDTETGRLVVAQVFVATEIVFRVAFEILIEGFTEAKATSSNGSARGRIKFLERRERGRSSTRWTSETYRVTVQILATKGSRGTNF